MPSLKIVSSPNPCSIKTIAGNLQANVQSSIQSSVNTFQASALAIKQAPANAVVELRQGVDNVIAATGIPTDANQLVSVISSNVAPQIANVVKDAAQSIGLSAANLSLSRLTPFEIPKLPNFPDLGEAGTLIGAGPKFIAEKLAEYTALVPPYIPKVPIGIAQAAAAIKLMRSVASANPSALLKALMQNIAQDVLDELGQSNAFDSAQSLLNNNLQCNLPILKDIDRAAQSLAGNVENATSQLNNSMIESTNIILGSVDQLQVEANRRLDESAIDIINQTNQPGNNIGTNPILTNNTANQSPPEG